MRKYIFLIGLLLMCIFSTSSFAKNNSENMNLEEIQKNYIIVKYKNGKIEKRLVSDFVEPEIKSISLDLKNENIKSDIDKAIDIANSNNEIEFSEPVIIFKANDILPNDINPNDSWRFDILGMNYLWEDFELIDFSQVIVAVIDTGVDLENDDLHTISGKDYVNDDMIADDDYGHGSHVAGVIGAITNNGNLVAGLANNVKIMPLKVLNSSGSGTNADVALAIEYAADNGADIINMSLGSGSESSLVKDAVEYAYGEGVVIVSSSGNSSNHWLDSEYPDENSGEIRNMEPMGYPAAFPEVISVGSIQYKDDEVIYISDFSDCSGKREIGGVEQEVFLDVVAPGSRIFSYIEDGTIEGWSGTSMAAPHVAGLAAIVKAKYNFLNKFQIREIINDTAIRTGINVPTYTGVSDDEIYGNGLINIKNAFGFDGLKLLNIKAYNSEGTELVINDYLFDNFIYSYDIELPEDTDKIVFNGEVMMDSSSIKLDGNNILDIIEIERTINTNEQTHIFNITSIYSESGNEIIKDYTFNFNILTGNEETYLSGLNVTDHNLTPTFVNTDFIYAIEDVEYEINEITVNA
ncbi:MAG: S8 family serine peptidase, partial [Bacillota bacterium]|nr:S8 family serine peptidase [Bacillota bacterium]